MDNIYNDELKVTLMKIKLQNDEEMNKELRENLLKSNLLVPVEKTNKEDEFNLVLLSNSDGDNYFQAYTDKDALSKWKDKEKYDTTVFSFDQYANILIDNQEVKGLVLNPFTENITLDSKYVEEIFSSDKVRIEILTEESKEIINEFKNILKNYTKITKAYLLKMYKKNIPGYLLVIDAGNISKKIQKDMFDKIGKEAIFNIEKLNLEITNINDKEIKAIIKDLNPFYMS